MSIIAVDIDGVVIKHKNIVFRFFAYLQKIFFNNTSKRKDWHIIYNTDKNKELNLKFHENSDDFKKLKADGHVVVLLSSRPKLLSTRTLKILNKTNLPFDYLILGCFNKVSFCKQNNVLALIDDNEKTCRKVMLNSDTKVINFNSESKKNRKLYLQTNNWEKILDYIDEEHNLLNNN